MRAWGCMALRPGAVRASGCAFAVPGLGHGASGSVGRGLDLRARGHRCIRWYGYAMRLGKGRASPIRVPYQGSRSRLRPADWMTRDFRPRRNDGRSQAGKPPELQRYRVSNQGLLVVILCGVKESFWRECDSSLRSEFQIAAEQDEGSIEWPRGRHAKLLRISSQRGARRYGPRGVAGPRRGSHWQGWRCWSVGPAV